MKILLVDYHNTTIRTSSVFQNLSYKNNFTGGLYGFMNIICSKINEFDIDTVLIVKDSKPYFRTAKYENYKQGRKSLPDKTKACLNQSQDLLTELFKILKLPVWAIKGYEADDLIAFIVEKYHSKHEIFVLSNDKDLFQLLHYDINLIRKAYENVYTRDTFEEEYKIKPLEWIMAEALTGTHNGIKGLKGVGIKTALSAIRKFDVLKKLDYKYKGTILGKGGLIETNSLLIKLPFRDLELKDPKIPDLTIQHEQRTDMRMLRTFLAAHGITFTDNMKNALRKINV